MNQLQTWQSLTPSVTAGDCHQRASDQTDDMATPSPSVFNRGALGAVIANPLPSPPSNPSTGAPQCHSIQ